ncbi:MAG: helix-turn-helix transcriptional regulator [Lachnospiraceae bacterium]|nr:helix-turn-helix transcriptional regulator [Lachnospiraceae bacterium]
MSKKLGTLIKDARTKKGISQSELASRIDGLSASALGKAERGESEPAEEIVRQIAKELGVTQTSLVDAMTGKAAGRTSSSKTSSSKTSSSKTSSSKTSSSKTTSSRSKSAGSASVKLTAAEKKLVELYRKADRDTKKAAVNLLSGKEEGIAGILAALTGGSGSSDLLGLLQGGKGGDSGDFLSSLISGASDILKK